MNEKVISRQYGLWDSPLKPVSLARGIGFSEVGWDRDGTLVWREGRSDRGVLVVQPPDGQARRDLNNEYSVRARVGYGGGDFTVGQGKVYFIEASSGRIYSQSLNGGVPHPVTPAFGQSAAPALSPDGRWLLFVHTYEGQDSLGIVDAEGTAWPARLVSGNDFYMQPAWHPDGDRIAWIAWDFPNMPWDGTFLNLAKIVRLSRSKPSQGLAGLPIATDIITVAGDENTSIFQPEFSPDGRYLAYVSDASGWWQIYLHDLESGAPRQLTSIQAEHGTPAWVQGERTYAFSPDGKSIWSLRNQEGVISLWEIDLVSGKDRHLPVDQAYTSLEQISMKPGGRQAALIASGGRQPSRVISVGSTQAEEHIWARATSEELPRDFYSLPQPINWQGMDGGTVYGLYYPPHNPDFAGIGKPPLIVHVHGGPTSQAIDAFNPLAQFFATRGYAFLEVNYRGSTGYGRAYRDMLRGHWGVYDVHDSVSGARSLAEQGQVDENKLVIMGGSAGGFTVLKALEDSPGFFKAGICLYGVSNQFTLAADTHKFEARYSDQLLGPLPQAAGIYRERSPIFFTDKIQDALVIFQGEEDVVVPRSQSDEVAASLQRRGVQHLYKIYPGEGHGFRKIENVENMYQTIEKFLRQYVIYA
jgi:dipeptidyl aminopeptidase/acylaminoacyl peptidase